MCNNCNVILAAAMAKAGRQDICLASKEASNQRARAGSARVFACEDAAVRAKHRRCSQLGFMAAEPCGCSGWL